MTNTGDSIKSNDHRRLRCPKLGHPVEFSYCRSPGSSLPCRKIFDCWWRTFDVEQFVRAHYSQDDIDAITAPTEDKVSSIIDLIRKAQSRDGREP